MKVQDVHRADTLVIALRRIDEFIEQANIPNKEGESERFGLLMLGQIFETNSMGVPSYPNLLWVDLATAILIGQATKKIIKDQLEQLGVEL